MKHRVGIEALAIAVPRRYLPMGDLAALRGIDPAKFTAGLGAREMAVADPGEDAVALAATATARLLREHAIDPARIGMIIVGTESAVDHSKAVASYVQGLLRLPAQMRTFDTKHACFGATAGVMTACDWIASGAADGRAAIVIGTDIARYGINTPGEPTQGAGAVAMLISDAPELLDIDHGLSGSYSADVHDFWRPVGEREARVDGHYSIQCYLDAVAGAYRGWRERALRREAIRSVQGLPSESLARIAYHVPFCKMARKAHLHLRAIDLADTGAPLDDPDTIAYEDNRSASSFTTQVASSLTLPARVGNTYTAALYLALASLVHAESEALRNKRIGLFSYGSGCTAQFFSGIVGARASQVIARARIDDVLEQRLRIDAAEYERIMNLDENTPLAEEPLPNTYRFAGLDGEHRRRYARGRVV